LITLAVDILPGGIPTLKVGMSTVRKHAHLKGGHATRAPTAGK
jgi:hypothetical protein